MPPVVASLHRQEAGMGRWDANDEERATFAFASPTVCGAVAIERIACGCCIRRSTTQGGAILLSLGASV